MDKKNERQNGKLIISLSRALQCIHKKSELLFYQNELSMAQFIVLEALYHKGDLTIKGIITAALSSSGNITVVVRNLERRNLIFRRDNPKDKRSFLISITEKGKELIVPVYTQHMIFVSEALTLLTEVEKEQIVFILKKISTNKEG